MKITSEDQQVSSKSKKQRQVLPQADYMAESTGLSGGTCRTIRWHRPGYPVHKGIVAQRLVPDGTGGEKPSNTGVTSRLSSVKSCSANVHLWCQIQRLDAPDRGTGLSGDTTRLSGVPERAATFLQRLVLCWSL
jgi:hypothetical protein